VIAAARDGAKLVMLPETYPGPYTVPVNYSPHEALAAVAGEEKVGGAKGIFCCHIGYSIPRVLRSPRSLKSFLMGLQGPNQHIASLLIDLDAVN